MSQITTIYISCEELCQAADINEEQLLELVAFNILAPVEGALPIEWQFESRALTAVTKAARIHRDLALDWADVALIMTLLDEIAVLKTENQLLKSRLGRFLN